MRQATKDSKGFAFSNRGDVGPDKGSKSVDRLTNNRVAKKRRLRVVAFGSSATRHTPSELEPPHLVNQSLDATVCSRFLNTVVQDERAKDGHSSRPQSRPKTAEQVGTPSRTIYVNKQPSLHKSFRPTRFFKGGTTV